MLCKPAQYLLRFDDLCPTVSCERWRRFAALVAAFHLRPILAVVPANRDPELEQSPADPGFWAGMRAMETAGAAIALHGYRHLCVGKGPSLVGILRRSEFAGVDQAVQRAWIGAGLRILRGHGLHPRLWVAPRHGFDQNTVRALQAEEIEAISDGFSVRPFTRAGLMWIPQQLWAPREKGSGLWTICIHPNTARDEELEALHTFVRGHAAQFTSVDRVLAEFPAPPLSIPESIHAGLALRHLQARSWRQRMLGF